MPPPGMEQQADNDPKDLVKQKKNVYRKTHTIDTIHLLPLQVNSYHNL